ncbi:hypothetical protein B5566_02515 [Mycobacterium sp. MHSD3]|nr:hypothetical protein B5566_02515 [Mycobacterium sp. MHSD3]
MNHAIGIVAHPSRSTMAYYLAYQVGSPCVAIDDMGMGCAANHRRTWEWLALRGHGDWCVVLEDDAVPVPSFREQLADALDHSPAPIVSLYLGRCRPGNAQATIRDHVAYGPDTPWLITNRLLHAVGVAIRTDLVASMVDHTAALKGCPIDEAISHWAATHQLPVAYTWPSLVDHADTPSLVHGPTRHHHVRRVAWRTGTRTTWQGEATQLHFPAVYC